TDVPDPRRVTEHYLIELRSALEVDYAAAGQAPPTWTDPTPIAGLSPYVRAAHFNEIRTTVASLRTAVGLGGLSAGTGWPVASTSRLRAVHLQDLRRWVGEYEPDVAALDAAKRARALHRYDEGGQAASARGRRTSM